MYRCGRIVKGPLQTASYSSTHLSNEEDQSQERLHPFEQALLFRLDSQEGHCGPISLDGEASQLQSITVRAQRIPAAAQVACEVVRQQTGDSIIVLLHSGIQVMFQEHRVKLYGVSGNNDVPHWHPFHIPINPTQSNPHVCEPVRAMHDHITKQTGNSHLCCTNSVLKLLRTLLQLDNRTCVNLDVGMLRGLGREPQTLAHLAPGDQFWLPVLRSQPGLLFFRPAGTLSIGISISLQVPVVGAESCQASQAYWQAVSALVQPFTSLCHNHKDA